MQFLYKLSYKKIHSPTPFLLKKVSFVGLGVLFFVVLSQFYPRTANASLFSFISDISGDKVSAKTVDTTNISNSQNMILLEAAINTDPNPYKKDESIVLSYGNALSAEIGPQGTASDVESRVSGEISLYTVRSGDTISKVAQMFDVSVNTIVWANELSKDTTTLKEGQTLLILPISGIKYIVKNGDTIRSIVLRYKSNLDEVLQYNDLTSVSTLKAGDIIIIPDAEPTYSDLPKIFQTKKTISTTSKAHDTNGPFYPGYYTRPIDGGVKTQGLHGYNGIDLAAPIGTVIHASAAGKVISSISNGSWNGGYGNYVIIAHNNGTQTLYAHTLKNFVKTGDLVEQGEMIAKIGVTGRTTGPHVHFEIRGAKNPF